MPSLHNDPFDRLLSAQAKIEGMAVPTNAQLREDGEPVRLL